MELSELDLSTEEGLKHFKTLLESKDWRLANLYWIKDKNAKKIKFKRNKDQVSYNKNAHKRNLNVKSRQKGFTTDACIDALDDALFTPYFDAGIIADDMDNAKAIFVNKVKFAYDNLPEIIRTTITANTDREGELRFNNGSSISVDTSFRGGTLRRLHISEFGKISIKYPKKALEIITGAFEAVPIDGRIDVESTAEGMTGAFYDMYKVAQEKKDKGSYLTDLDFRLHFYPWYTTDEYRLNPEGVEIHHKTLAYFEFLKNNHGIILDDAQKAWYAKKEEQQKGMMKQEYPSYPEEAFMNSGRPVFDSEMLSAKIAAVENIKFRQGFFDANGVFVDDKSGPYKIFKGPKDNRKYTNGADIAEGLETGDFSTMSILNKDLEQVATYFNHTHPDLFGAEMIAMGNYYNQALLAPETNNHGLTTLTHILGKSYPFVFMREVLDERTNQFVKKVGWQTNMKTKPIMLDNLVAAVRDNLVKINDIETLREMLTLTFEPDGSVNLNGKDRIVSLAIALQAINQVHEVQLGSFETSKRKEDFKDFKEMLEWGENNRFEESYFND